MIQKNSAVKGIIGFIVIFCLISFNSYSQDSTKTPDFEIFITEVMPEFPGGQEQLNNYIKNNIRLPKSKKLIGKRGRVYTQFKIGTDGSINNVKVIKGMNEEVDKEAIRLMSNMPNWKPGEQNGKVVEVIYTLPIYFEY